MRKHFKTALALLLTVLMCVSLLVPAYAATKCNAAGKTHSTKNCTNYTVVGTVEPTCGTVGYTIYRCTICKLDFIDNYVDPTGDHQNVVDVPYVKETCGDGNIACKYCEDCKKHFSLDGSILLEDTVEKGGYILKGTGKHDSKGKEITTATCEKAGAVYKTCSVCGYYDDTPYDSVAKTGYKVKDVAANGHYWEVFGVQYGKTSTLLPNKINAEPTCAEKGEALYICKYCKAEKTVDIYATGAHKLVKVAAVSATCTTGGNKEYYYCETCGQKFTDDTGATKITDAEFTKNYVIAAAHDMDAVKTLAPTCSGVFNDIGDYGFKYTTCKLCGYSEILATYAPGQHVEGNANIANTAKAKNYAGTELTTGLTDKQMKNDSSTVTAATCTSPKMVTRYCTICQKIITKGVASGAPLGHTNTLVTIPATDANPSYSFYICTRKGCTLPTATEYINDVDAYTNQKVADGKTYAVNKDAQNAPDVIAKLDKVCLIVDAEHLFTVGDKIDSTGEYHNWAVETVVAGDCATGTPTVTFRYCTICNLHEQVVTATEHTPENVNRWIYNSKTKAYEEQSVKFADAEPVCTDVDGMKTTCAICGLDVVDTSRKYVATYTYYDLNDAKAAHYNNLASAPYEYREATCALYGYAKYACTGCSMSVIVVDNALKAHTDDGIYKSEDNEAPATVCATAAYKCTVCGTFVASTVKHSGTAVQQKADCTAKNINVWQCSGCKKYFSDKNRKNELTTEAAYKLLGGHSFKVVAANEKATCSTPAYAVYSVCTNEKCALKYQQGVPGKVTSGDYAVLYADYIATSKAGLLDSAAGKQMLADIARYGYKYVETKCAGSGTTPTVVNQIVAPTCTQYGFTHYFAKCDVCNELVEYITDYVPATGHQNVVDKAAVAFNCAAQTDGYTAGKYCTDCNTYVEGGEVVKYYHQNANGKLVNFCGDTNPNRVCAVCGGTFPISHSMIAQPKVVAHTCISYGYEITYCTECGYSEYKIVDATYGEHNYKYDAKTQSNKCTVCDAVEALGGTIALTAYNVNSPKLTNAKAEIVDGATIEVDVTIKGSNLEVWGASFELGYDASYLVFDRAEVGDSQLASIVGNPESGIIRGVAIAPNDAEGKQANIVLDGTETLAKLFFTVKITQPTKIVDKIEVPCVKGDAGYIDPQASHVVTFKTTAAITAKDKELDTVAANISATYAPLMDVDGNGLINIQDLNDMTKIISHESATTYKAAADINNDGIVDDNDLSKLLQYLAGIVSYADLIKA